MNQPRPIRDDAAQLLREDEVAGSADSLHGAAFADGRLVLASGRYLLRLVPGSERIVDRLHTSRATAGLAYDGEHLWHHAEGILEQVRVRTGLAVRSTASPLPDRDVTGIECLGAELIIAHEGGRRLSRVRVRETPSSSDAAVLTTVPTRLPLRGLTWSGGELWSSSDRALVRVDPMTGEILERIVLPGPARVFDLAADEHGRFWCVDGTSRILRVLAPPGWTEQATIAPERTRSQPASHVIDVTARSAAGASITAPPADVMGTTFDRILVPVDFSASARRALATALVMQDRLGSEVHLFHLAQLGANAEFLAGSGASVASGDIEDDARARMVRFLDNVFPGRAAGIVVHTDVGENLVEAIEQVCREIGATLVLLVGRPRHVLFRAPIEKIALHVPAAVMILEPPETGGGEQTAE